MDGFKIGSSVDTCIADELGLGLTESAGDLAAGANAAAAAAGRFLDSVLATDRELEAESLEAGGGKC
jgi:hypothetical protein